MTDRQKLDREYKRMLSVVESAGKGQEFISRKLHLLRDSTILTPEYQAAQQADYDKYQAMKEKAAARIIEIKAIAFSNKLTA